MKVRNVSLLAGILIGTMITFILTVLIRPDTSVFGESEANSAAVDTSFTYQGRLQDGSSPANGDYDLRFTLYDSASGGNSVGSPVTKSNTTLTDGLFTVTLDFGSNAFQGDARWLGIEVRPSGGGGSYSELPRQPLTATPYSLYAIDADQLDGLQANAFARDVDNVLTVAPNGGDFSSIQTALDSINAPSEDNKYLVQVAPGTYTETVNMKAYVTIEGAGQEAVTITSAGGPDVSDATVTGANNAALRRVTVENSGGDTYAVAIYNFGTSPRIRHVTARAYNGSDTSIGMWNDIDIFDPADPIVEDSTIIGNGNPSSDDAYGIYNVSSESTVRDSVVRGENATAANYGIYTENPENFATSIVISNSVIVGDDAPIINSADNFIGVDAVSSQLDGDPTVPGGGTIKCAGVYDETYDFFSGPACP